MKNEKGECLCGKIRYRISGDINGFFLCHCTRCQKSSGSAHGSNAFLKNASVLWDSGEQAISQYKVPDSRFIKNFCSQCGSPLPVSVAGEETVCVPAGSLLDYDDFDPTAHIFVRNKKAWEDKLSSAATFDALP